MKYRDVWPRPRRLRGTCICVPGTDALTRCEQPLMGSDGVLVGEVAHIEAALPSGPRFRENMSNEERRGFANLLLVCGTHHTVIDADVNTWTATRLSNLKREHEAVYTAAVDLLRSTVGDVTELTTWKSPVNLGRFPHVASLTPDELASDIATVQEFAKRLSGLPIGARSVLALIVGRGRPLRTRPGDHEVAIPAPLLERIVSCTCRESSRLI